MFADPGGTADSDAPCSLAHHLRSKSASHTGQTAVMVAASYVWPAGDEARRSPQVVDCEAVGIPPNPTRLSAESSFNEVGSGFRGNVRHRPTRNTSRSRSRPEIRAGGSQDHAKARGFCMILVTYHLRCHSPLYVTHHLR
jgi:hypothetical protein